VKIVLGSNGMRQPPTSSTCIPIQCPRPWLRNISTSTARPAQGNSATGVWAAAGAAKSRANSGIRIMMVILVP
jgi:hypothetical protein